MSGLWSVWRARVWRACVECVSGARVRRGTSGVRLERVASGGRVLENASRACLQRRGGSCLEHVWSMSRACLECTSGACLECASGACLERARLERIARICRHVRSMCVLSLSGASGRSLEESCLERTSGVGVCI